MSAVLDASALLAHLWNERGAEKVERVVSLGAVIGAVNLAEALSKVSDRGGDPERVASTLGPLTVVPLDYDQALEIARLRRDTRRRGLSLGDRACLALGRALNLPVLTADRSWGELRLGIEIRPIR